MANVEKDEVVNVTEQLDRILDAASLATAQTAEVNIPQSVSFEHVHPSQVVGGVALLSVN